MANVANIVGGLVAFQIGAHGLWHKGETGVFLESPVVVPEILAAGVWRLTDVDLGVSTRLLSWLYEFHDFHTVVPFLRQNPILVPLLLEMYGQICLRFGSENRLALENFTDPEAGSDHGLVVLVRTRLTPERAREMIDDFDMEWWLDALPRAQHKLTVVVEYM